MRKQIKVFTKFIKRLIKLTIKVCVFCMFSFLIMTGIDYIQVIKGDYPVFIISRSMNQKRQEIFQGFFHSLKRNVYASKEEPLYHSSKIEFSLFTLKLPIEVSPPKKEDTSIKVELTEKESCQNKSDLYYASEDIKVYTYCLDTIKINQKELKDLLEENPALIEELESKMTYQGISRDISALEFIKDNYKIYHCHKENNQDIYIGNNKIEIQKDFCTSKNDDLKFIFEIVDETPKDLEKVRNEKGEVIPEVFYEDAKYSYQFILPKSKYVFIKTSAVRGQEEQKINIKEALNKQLITITDLEEKGLEFYKKEKSS